MTDLEISKALALAIGWRDHNIDPDVITIRDAYAPESEIHCWDKSAGLWRVFDYRDWNVAGPIAARYSAFPVSVSTGDFRKAKKQGFTDVDFWEVCLFNYKTGRELNGKWDYYHADTPQKAIALAVLGAMK